MAITVSDVYIRPGDTNDPFGYIEQIRGGWITVADSASMAAIPFERAKDGQIAYLQDEKLFYIATKVAASQTFDPGPPPSVVSTPASLTWKVLPFSGSFSGSFQGDGSGLTGVGGVPGGDITQLQFYSSSTDGAAFGGAEVYYISSSGNLGIGISNPTAKLHVDGDAIITGTLTAQEFHTEFVSASIIYQSGSTKFGDSADDNHAFTGSINISGSITATSKITSPEFSGSFSGSFQGDGSNLTGIASTLALSGSTGNDLVNLKTDALKITGSVNNVDVAVTNNQAAISVSQNLTLSNVNLTGSFKGDGSNLTGIASTLALSGSTGNDLVNLKTDALTITGSARNIDVAITDNKAAITVADNLQLGNVELTGSFKGNFSGSITAVIENAVTASYVLNAVSASYASSATSSSYALTASYVPGYVRDSGGQTDEIAIWSSTDQISGSQGFFVSRSYGGNVSTILDGYYYAENNGGFVAHSVADDSGSKSTIGMYDPGTGTAIIYAGSGSGQVVGAIKFAVNALDQAYAIGVNISPNKANTLRIEPTVELLAGMSGSFSGSFYGQFVGLIDSASYAVYAVNATTASYSLTSTSASYALTATSASHAVNALSASYAATSTSASHALFANSATTASFAASSLTASYFTGSHIDFTPRVAGSEPAHRAGRVFYDATEGALAVYNDVADVTMQVGQEFWIRAINKSGNPILNGTPVRISGSTGDRPNIWPAVAENHIVSQFGRENHIIGVATNDIADNATGYITAQGIVRKLNTTAFTAGDTLYLQTGSAGFRNTPPPFPYDVVRVGWVTKVNAGNGLIFVEPKSPVHLRDIAVISGSENTVTYDVLVKNANGGFAPRHNNMILSGSFSGSFAGTIDRAVSSSHAIQADSASFAVTSSYALKAESVGQLNQDVVITGDLTVFGSSSFYHVTSSQLDVDSAFISVNVFEPIERFGGLRVYDSGSSDATASFAWDSLHDHWVYQNVSGSTYSGAMFMSGPRNTGSLGEEPTLTKWYVARSDGGDHLENSQIWSSGSDHIVYGDLFTTGTTSGSFVGDGSGLFGVAANPAGLNKSVQFKSGSVTGGASNFFYDHTTARVGIGTASPESPLEVVGRVQSNGYIARGDYAGFSSLPDAGMYAANISFDDGFGALLIASRTDATRAIAFGTYNGTAMGERMRITGVGSVGIGTTSPAALLTVSNTTDNGAAVRVQRTNALSGSYTELGTVGGSGRIESFNGNLTIGADASNTDSSSVIQFKVDNSEKVRITSTGNVGLGTTTPTSGSLQIYNTTGTNHIVFDGGASTANSYIGAFAGGMYLSTNYYYDSGHRNDIGSLRSMEIFMGDDLLQIATMPSGSPGTRTRVMVISGSQGYVGVGTTAPSAQLHVYSTGNGELEVQRASGALFNVQAQSSLAAIGTDSNHPLYLKTNAGTRAQISTGGALRLNNYGSGTQTGTATKSLAVDSSGNVIEIDVSSNGTGVANEVAFWKDTDTVSGSQALTWDGTTLSINGILEANEKSFVIDHPTQPGKKLVYGVLEGPEHAVYCRGKINGNVIELPEEWTGLVHEDSITVQLTSIGKHQNLYVVDVRDNRVFIKNGDLLTSKINAYYYIQGTRKDTKPLQTVRDK